jgi:hypothetical protein
MQPDQFHDSKVSSDPCIPTLLLHLMQSIYVLSSNISDFHTPKYNKDVHDLYFHILEDIIASIFRVEVKTA